MTAKPKPKPKLEDILAWPTDLPEDPDIILELKKIRFGLDPMPMKCPICQKQMKTWTDPYPTIRTHLIAFCLCLICFWPCVPCVYGWDRTLAHRHYCSECYKYLGESRLIACFQRRRNDEDEE